VTPRYRCTGQSYGPGDDPRDRWHPDTVTDPETGEERCRLCGAPNDDEEVDP
jgi:hypothetical protein